MLTDISSKPKLVAPVGRKPRMLEESEGARVNGGVRISKISIGPSINPHAFKYIQYIKEMIG